MRSDGRVPPPKPFGPGGGSAICYQGVKGESSVTVTDSSFIPWSSIPVVCVSPASGAGGSGAGHFGHGGRGSKSGSSLLGSTVIGLPAASLTILPSAPTTVISLGNKLSSTLPSVVTHSGSAGGGGTSDAVAVSAPVANSADATAATTAIRALFKACSLGAPTARCSGTQTRCCRHRAIVRSSKPSTMPWWRSSHRRTAEQCRSSSRP